MDSQYVFSQSVAPRGLVNLGNTCYMNSVVQCMMSVEEFANAMTAVAVMKRTPYFGIVGDSFKELVGMLRKKGCEAYCCDKFKGMVAICWPSYKKDEQEDVVLFFNFLCDALHEDLKVASEDTSDFAVEDNLCRTVVMKWRRLHHSPVSWAFQMQIVVARTCNSCSCCSVSYEDISWVLPLSITTGTRKTTVSGCLAATMETEFIQESRCDMCQHLGRRHQLLLGRLPPVLVIQLKRFKTVNQVTSKIKTSVEVEEVIDLSPYCVDGVQSATSYKLLGFVNHNGDRPSAGHYKASSLRGDRWYTFDDSKVTNTTKRDFAPTQAYLLFYEQQKVPCGDLPLDCEVWDPVHDRIIHSFTASYGGNEKEKENFVFNRSLSMQGKESDEGDLDTLVHLSQDNNNNLEVSQLGYTDWDLEEFHRGIAPHCTPQPDASDEVTYNNGNVSPDLFASQIPTSQDTFSLDLFASEVSMSQAQDGMKQLSQELSNLQVSQGNNVHHLKNVNDHVIDKDQNTVVSMHSQLSPCQHPDMDLDVIDPILTEDDIHKPGAKLDLDNLDSYSVSLLRFWLACRGLHQTGKKEELKQRILNHRRLQHKINPGVDKGKWYLAKRKKMMDEAYNSRQCYPIFPIQKSFWKPFPSVHIPNNYSAGKAIEYLEAIPQVRFSFLEGVTVWKEGKQDEPDEEGLYDFTLPTQQDRKQLFISGTIKRANQFVDSGRVINVEDGQKDKHYFVKAQVQASMANAIYGINILIAQSSGSVCMADCHCKARALYRCCHVMAVLLLIGRHVEERGHEAVTCTGRRCYWVAPPNARLKDPGVVKNKHEYYIYTNYERRAYFDPRPKAHIVANAEEKINWLKDALAQLGSKVLWSYQLPLLQEDVYVPDPEAEVEFPDTSTTETIADLCSYMIWNLNQIRHVSADQPVHFPLTHHQSESEWWKPERAVRIPASDSQQAAGLLSPRSTENGKINFLRKHVWHLDRKEYPAMLYGKEMEPRARRAYTSDLRREHPELQVVESGIWVNPKQPHLSCSPDALVTDTNGILKLVEFKSPFILQGLDPKKFEDLPTKQLEHFCLKRCKTTGNIELKKGNKWYWQIQQSMDILNLPSCDFVVYSELDECGMKIPQYVKLEVPFDESFWNEKRGRLLKVHREMVVPEYFFCNSVFRRPVRRLVYAPYHEDHEDDYFYFGCERVFTMTLENESEFLLNIE